MKAYEAIARALVAEEVDVAFGLLGGGTEHLVDAVARHGIRFVAVRHEQTAVGMADGYARTTGRVGVAILSHGPGLANAATPMVVARKARSRVLVIASDVGAHERFTLHRFDQEPFLRATIGAHIQVKAGAVLQLDLADAFGRLGLDDGPVALNVPADVFQQDVAERAAHPGRLAGGERPRLQPAAPGMARLATLLAEARRPLLLAGRGAVLSAARDELQRLAERTGAALAETLPAKGWFAGHPHRLGFSGGFGEPAVQSLLASADLVVGFGTSLTRWTSHWGTLYETARIALVDVRPGVRPEMNELELSIQGDAGAAAVALLAALDVAAVPGRPLWTTGFTPAPATASSAESEWTKHYGLAQPALERPLEGVDPRLVVDLLDVGLPRDRALVVDAGNQMGVPAAHFSVADPLAQVFAWEFGAIGLGLAEALGAAVGRPDRPTVVFLGDGSLMLALSDLDTAVRSGARLLVVVADDGGFRSERGSYLARGLEPSLADYDNPDIAAIASAAGWQTYRAADNDAARAAVALLLATDPSISRPTLLHLKVDKLVPCVELDRAFANYRPY